MLDLIADLDDAAAVGSTIGLSRQPDLSGIADGIENCVGADRLVSIGCEEGHGHFFGRPIQVHGFRTPVCGTTSAGQG